MVCMAGENIIKVGGAGAAKYWMKYLNVMYMIQLKDVIINAGAIDLDLFDMHKYQKRVARQRETAKESSDSSSRRKKDKALHSWWRKTIVDIYAS